MTKNFWISFDLGIKGDYEAMYSWLDSSNAKECGDNFAYITNYDYDNVFIDDLKEDLNCMVKINPTDRIYIVYRKDDTKDTGTFLFGKRKRNPWQGFSTDSSVEDNNED
jgi:hypothetical protein